MGKILVWGDVDVTWHYRQSAVDTAGPAKDRSQKQWSGVASYGLSGLHVRQLQELAPKTEPSLFPEVIHGLWSIDDKADSSKLSTLEQEKRLPIFGYSIGSVPKTRKKGESSEVLRVKEPYGWTPCVWKRYRTLVGGHLATACNHLQQSSPSVVLLNDAGWGCLRGYFDDAEAGGTDKPVEQGKPLREWLQTKTNGVDLKGSFIFVKSRIYPPVEYEEKPGKHYEDGGVGERDWPFATYKSRMYGEKSGIHGRRCALPIDQGLIVMVNVSDLRLLGTNVSRGISWERTVQHILEAARSGFSEAGQIVGLLEARYVIVVFSVDGIVLIDRGREEDRDGLEFPKATLFFHGPDIEGDSERKVVGRAYGTTTWISSILTYLLAQAEPKDVGEGWWQDALRASLAYVRKLNQEGNQPNDAGTGDVNFGLGNEGESGPQFAGWTKKSFDKDKDDPIFDPGSLFERFADWHKLREKLREVRSRREGNLEKLANGRPLEGDMSDELNQAEAALAEINLDKLVAGQRLFYTPVHWSDIQPEPYKGPKDDSLRRPWFPERFREKWWSFLSNEIAFRSKHEVAPEEDVRFAKAAVRYAFEVMRYGGWDEREYFPFPLFVPYVEFGALRTCDRAEIEGLRNFSSIVGEHLRRKEDQPLNVAVFGPPGAGKSFAVKQVITSLSSEKPPVFLTFNLSQFQSPDQLRACYQVVQNEVLKGNLPVVFWDEFDTTLNEVPFGWLHAFLAPMQDGTFINEQRENKIGACIFVFAGSRFDRFADLPEPRDSLERPREEMVTMTFREVQERAQMEDLIPVPPQEVRRLDRINLRRRQEDWRVAKGNDFRSRLKGYLDVQDCNLRPNPGEYNIPTLSCRDANTCDQLNFLVRRARMVRENLMRELPELFVKSKFPRFPLRDEAEGKWIADASAKQEYRELKINDEIAFGLLSPYSFIHGVRSIETVLKTCELSEKSRFERAFLQTGEMLSVHIRPDAFEYTRGCDPRGAQRAKTFDFFLDDWYRKYESVVHAPKRLGRPLVEWRTAKVGRDSYPCLLYGDGIMELDGDGKEKDIPKRLLRADETDRPDRLEILISRHDNRNRPELWHTVAYDRGSPYVLNFEKFMLEELGLGAREVEGFPVYVACRWWRNQECGALSSACRFVLKRKGDTIRFAWDGARRLIYRDSKLDELPPDV